MSYSLRVRRKPQDTPIASRKTWDVTQDTPISSRKTWDVSQDATSGLRRTWDVSSPSTLSTQLTPEPHYSSRDSSSTLSSTYTPINTSSTLPRHQRYSSSVSTLSQSNGANGTNNTHSSSFKHGLERRLLRNYGVDSDSEGEGQWRSSYSFRGTSSVPASPRRMPPPSPNTPSLWRKIFSFSKKSGSSSEKDLSDVGRSSTMPSFRDRILQNRSTVYSEYDMESTCRAEVTQHHVVSSSSNNLTSDTPTPVRRGSGPRLARVVSRLITDFKQSTSTETTPSSRLYRNYRRSCSDSKTHSVTRDSGVDCTSHLDALSPESRRRALSVIDINGNDSDREGEKVVQIRRYRCLPSPVHRQLSGNSTPPIVRFSSDEDITSVHSKRSSISERTSMSDDTILDNDDDNDNNCDKKTSEDPLVLETKLYIEEPCDRINVTRENCQTDKGNENDSQNEIEDKPCQKDSDQLQSNDQQQSQNNKSNLQKSPKPSRTRQKKTNSPKPPRTRLNKTYGSKSKDPSSTENHHKKCQAVRKTQSQRDSSPANWIKDRYRSSKSRTPSPKQVVSSEKVKIPRPESKKKTGAIKKANISEPKSTLRKAQSETNRIKRECDKLQKIESTVSDRPQCNIKDESKKYKSQVSHPPPTVRPRPKVKRSVSYSPGRQVPTISAELEEKIGKLLGKPPAVTRRESTGVLESASAPKSTDAPQSIKKQGHSSKTRRCNSLVSEQMTLENKLNRLRPSSGNDSTMREKGTSKLVKNSQAHGSLPRRPSSAKTFGNKTADLNLLNNKSLDEASKPCNLQRDLTVSNDESGSHGNQKLACNAAARHKNKSKRDSFDSAAGGKGGGSKRPVAFTRQRHHTVEIGSDLASKKYMEDFLKARSQTNCNGSKATVVAAKTDSSADDRSGSNSEVSRCKHSIDLDLANEKFSKTTSPASVVSKGELRGDSTYTSVALKYGTLRRQGPILYTNPSRELSDKGEGSNYQSSLFLHLGKNSNEKEGETCKKQV